MESYATERERYCKAALHDIERCRKQVSVAAHAGRLAKLAADELLILPVIPAQAGIQCLRVIECSVTGFLPAQE